MVLAEDNYLIREGLIMLMGADPEIELVGAASDYASLIKQVEDKNPDVLITDVRMPPTHTDEGIRAAASLRTTHPGLAVVVLSQYAEPEYALALLEGGSAGRAYLLKDAVADVDELSQAVRAVAGGGSIVDPKVVDKLVAVHTSAATTPLANLTPREVDVLRLMAQGHSNSAIGRDLFLSDRGVEKHSNAIFSKLGVSEETNVNKRVKAVLVFLASDVRA